MDATRHGSNSAPAGFLMAMTLAAWVALLATPAVSWGQAPFIDDMFPTNGPTNGGTVLTIVGSNFGTAPGTIRFGAQQLQPTLWSDTQVQTETPAGVGLNIQVFVVAGGQFSNSKFFSYDGPSIGSLIPTSGPTAGGTLLTINGTNFGAIPGAAEFDDLFMSITSWTHGRVVATLPPGVGLDKRVRITTASGTSNEASFDYFGPTIGGISPPSGPTQGGMTLTIFGSNFGPAPGVVTIGGTPATIGAPADWSHGLIRCITPPGVGLNKEVKVTTASGEAGGAFFNYAAPGTVSMNPTSGTTAGGTVLTINGQNFGAAPGQVLIGDEPAEIVTPNGWTHAQVRCITPPGTGLNKLVVVVTESGTSNPQQFSYNAPTVDGINPTHGPTPGGTILTIHGNDFGPSPGTATLGTTSMVIVEPGGWSHTQVLAVVPQGVGLNQLVRITTASGMSSQQVTFDYDRPEISGISPPTAPTQGGVLLTINGTSFGAVNGTVTLGGVSAQVQPGTWTHTRVVVTVPAGNGVDNPLRVISASGAGDPFLFDYAPPAISGISPISGPLAGGIPLTINGSSFGSVPATVTVGGRPAQVIDWGHSLVRVTSPAGCGLNQDVRVSSPTGESNAVLFHYDPAHEAGDLNCDCDVDLDDVEAFVSALLDPAQPHGCIPNAADMNGDRQTDGSDIGAFIQRLLGP